MISDEGLCANLLAAANIDPALRRQQLGSMIL
jgi:hypothetical protein